MAACITTCIDITPFIVGSQLQILVPKIVPKHEQLPVALLLLHITIQLHIILLVLPITVIFPNVCHLKENFIAGIIVTLPP